MIVVGTAGHIDHGKSSLITRLTGIDPDRLPEEKLRGMTIDLGFAWYDTASGKRIGIVDVPGHERFVRNMIAGTGGIDAVILVVAADDGWMPQSQEHLQITRMLGIKYGIVALTKIDLVEKNWLELVEEDIREKLQGTFLEGAPVVRLSATTGAGFDRLRQEIDTLAERIVQKDDIGKPRLFIDRSFVLSGMGGVVTGTLREGCLQVGQEVAVFPSRRRGRIRTLQSHNQQVTESYPGQRTALSLTGIDKEFFGRGGVVSLPGLIESYPADPVLVLNITNLPESPFPLTDRRRLLMILGTTETEGEARLLGRETIMPGETGTVFYRPFAPVLAFVGDRFIIRLATPQVTIGGGVVKGIIDAFPRKKDQEKYQHWLEEETPTADSFLRMKLSGRLFVDRKHDFGHGTFSDAMMERAIADMMARGGLREFNGRYYLAAKVDNFAEKILRYMQTYFDEQPHREGIPPEILTRALGLQGEDPEWLLEMLLARKQLVKKKNLLDIPGRVAVARGDIKKAADELEKILLKEPFMPPSIEELLAENRARKEALDFLVTGGRAIKIPGGLVFHAEAWHKIMAVIKTTLDHGEMLTVAALREKLNSSRKYVVPILEETDRLGITRREGDVRHKGERYDK